MMNNDLFETCRGYHYSCTVHFEDSLNITHQQIH